MTFEHNLEKYAELTVRVALNIQSGQSLWIKRQLGTPNSCDSFPAKLMKPEPNMYILNGRMKSAHKLNIRMRLKNRSMSIHHGERKH